MTMITKIRVVLKEVGWEAQRRWSTGYVEPRTQLGRHQPFSHEHHQRAPTPQGRPAAAELVKGGIALSVEETDCVLQYLIIKQENDYGNVQLGFCMLDGVAYSSHLRYHQRRHLSDCRSQC